MRARIAALVGLSALGHALAIAPAFAPPERVDAAARIGIGGAAARAVSISQKTARDDLRRSIVERAKSGRLSLGAFLIATSAIDAQEEDRTLDVAEMDAEYGARVGALRVALEETTSVRDAVARAFADMRYFGRPGGLAGDALIERGGSCEQISELVVAAALDAGVAEVSLRYYGGAGDSGASHLAPIVRVDGVDYDLASGKVASAGGASVAPEEIVEAYARVHGRSPSVDPTSQAPVTAAARAEESSRPSIAGGLPRNDDVFGGDVPLFAVHAIAPPTDGDHAPVKLPARGADSCGYVLTFSILDPLRVDFEGTPVEVRRQPSAAVIERRAELLEGAEARAREIGASDIERLMAFACAAAAGRDLSDDLALAGDLSVAKEARRRGDRSALEGSAALAEFSRRAPRGSSARSAALAELHERFAGQTWLLLALEGGEDVVLDLASEGDAWQRLNDLAALIVDPVTRDRALGLVAALDRRDQVDVMHDVFHARGVQRPWTSNYILDAPSSDFAIAYGVFRPVLHELWDDQAPVGEVLAVLDRGVRSAKLDDAWDDALLDYVARVELNMMERQPGGFGVVDPLRAAVARRRRPSLSLLSQRLDEIHARGNLDPETLAEAWRLR